jgi:hypothetical protein
MRGAGENLPRSQVPLEEGMGVLSLGTRDGIPGHPGLGVEFEHLVAHLAAPARLLEAAELTCPFWPPAPSPPPCGIGPVNAWNSALV